MLVAGIIELLRHPKRLTVHKCQLNLPTFVFGLEPLRPELPPTVFAVVKLLHGHNRRGLRGMPEDQRDSERLAAAIDDSEIRQRGTSGQEQG